MTFGQAVVMLLHYARELKFGCPLKNQQVLAWMLRQNNSGLQWPT